MDAQQARVGRRRPPRRSSATPLQSSSLQRRVSLAAARCLVASSRRSARLEVGQQQLGLDDLEVGPRIDLRRAGARPFGCSNARTTCSERVDLADVAEEAVAEALARVRAAHQAGDVHELDLLGHPPLDAERVADRVQALVGHGHDGDVRLDRRERILGRLRPGAA